MSSSDLRGESCINTKLQFDDTYLHGNVILIWKLSHNLHKEFSSYTFYWLEGRGDILQTPSDQRRDIGKGNHDLVTSTIPMIT